MAYPRSNDPVKPRGVSIPDSLWESLKLYAKAEQRTASALLTILAFEAVNARRIKYGESPFADLEELRLHSIEVVKAGTPDYGPKHEAVMREEAAKKQSKVA